MYEHERNELFFDGDDLIQVIRIGKSAMCHFCWYCDQKGNCRCHRDIAGACMATFRRDKHDVIFFRVGGKHDVRIS